MRLSSGQARELGEAILDAVEGVQETGTDYVVISFSDFDRAVAMADDPASREYDFDRVMVVFL